MDPSFPLCASRSPAVRVLAAIVTAAYVLVIPQSPAYAAEHASISGVVFHDLNDNGARDSGEPGLFGQVTLSRDGEPPMYQDVESDGVFSFEALDPGTYVVEAWQSWLPVDATTSTTTNPVQVTVDAEEAEQVDFGFVRTDGSISGAVFDDANGDGIYSSTERTLGGVTVELAKDGLLVASTNTASDGWDNVYQFDALRPGTYTVTVIPLANYTATTPTTRTVTLTSGDYRESLNFGLQPAAGGAATSACPEDRVPTSSFGDVAGNFHRVNIDCVVWWGVANGLDASTYGPRQPVTRAQMASFTARMIEESGRSLPAGPDAFNDDDGNPHEANINKLAAAEIVSGKTAGRFAPGDRVTRAQMATFLVRTYEYVTQDSLDATRENFPDISTSVHRLNINKAAEAGFTAGTADGTYKPAADVRRDQMASFIARTLDGLVQAGHGLPPSAR